MRTSQLPPAPIELLIATSNPGKRNELKALVPAHVKVLVLEDVGLTAPEERGTTLEQNAAMKATTAAQKSGLLTIADDSGLEVDALNGAPGVYSARFAGPSASDAENRERLLHLLVDIPLERRSARFRCRVALATPDVLVAEVDGTCDGRIAFRELGTRGFGYDAVFVLEDGRTMAELSDADKNVLSHRASAMRKLGPYLAATLAQLSDKRKA